MAVPAVLRLDPRLERAVGHRGRERGRIDDLLDDLADALEVVRADLRLELAPLRDDVARRPSADEPDVRARQLVDPAERHVDDRARRGEDRRAALLGIHPRVRRPAVEAERELLRARRAEDHLADRRRLVVDVADARLEALDVEARRADEADLLHRREEQLHPGMRPPSSTMRRAASSITTTADLLSAPRIVPPALRTTPSSPTTGLELALERHGVEVGAEEDRHAALGAPRAAGRRCSRSWSRAAGPRRPPPRRARSHRAHASRGRRRRAPRRAGSGSRRARGRARSRRDVSCCCTA